MLRLKYKDLARIIKVFKLCIKKDVHLGMIEEYTCLKGYNSGLPDKLQLTEKEYNEVLEVFKLLKKTRC